MQNLEKIYKQPFSKKKDLSYTKKFNMINILFF